MEKETVFILGAGASQEVDLPTGVELKDNISSLLDIHYDDWNRKISGSDLIDKAFRILTKTGGPDDDIRTYIQKSWQIRDSLPLATSIDDLIDSHRDDNMIATCGKLAIVNSILDAEKGSKLFIETSDMNSKIDFSSLSKTWYNKLFQILRANCTKNELKSRFESTSFIIFNYDRCLEHFMFNALQDYYHLEQDEAIEMMSCINIFHPYGSVGHLPWSNQSCVMGFGGSLSPNKLIELSKGIKTFTEGTDPSSSEILEIKQEMNTADRIVFLGFAFHELNMQLISPKKLNRVEKDLNCFATTYNISESDKEVIKGQINSLYMKKVKTKMIDNKCFEFFSEFWRSLAF
ncbi:MAG: hypothetical protein JW794_04000 [Candidatus Cloacimonetes bacterium]|nr:hypothetical protein [Candidatus Cloacimonadota bacterium]